MDLFRGISGLSAVCDCGTTLEAGHNHVLLTNECSSFFSFRRVVVFFFTN